MPFDIKNLSEEDRNFLETYGKQIIAEFVKSQNMDSVDMKHAINPNNKDVSVAEQEKMTPAERMQTLMIGIRKQSRELIEKAIGGVNETTGADGGYFVPDAVDFEIRRLMTSYGVIRQDATILPMGKSKTLKYSGLASGVTINWTGEGEVITASKPQFSQASASVKEMTGLTVFTNEFLEDMNTDIANFVMNLFAENMAKEEDDQGFNGTSVFTGLFNLSGVVETTLAAGKINFADITYPDLVTVKNSVPANYLQNAKWYVSRAVLSVIETLTDGNGRYIYVPTGLNNSLLGYPVRVVESAPNTDAAGKPALMLANLKKTLVLDKAGTKIDLASTGNVTVGENANISLFQTNQSALRMIKRVGFANPLPGAYTRLKTAAV